MKQVEINRPTVHASILSVERTHIRERSDELCVEEPLEIRILAGFPAKRHSLAVTMRTPGNDLELAAGFAFTEGIVAGLDDLRDVAHCGEGPESNIVNVCLARHVAFDPARFTRNVYTTSSCGICSKATIDQVKTVCPVLPRGKFTLTRSRMVEYLHRLDEHQTVFSRTGGLHAAALFDAQGRMLCVREDVGRHNAVDKVVGSMLLEKRLPASDTVALVSGRASYELVQKALLAGIPALAAVGAPSSLAVDTAREFGMTLIGFLRDGRFNVYAGEDRIAAEG